MACIIHTDFNLKVEYAMVNCLINPSNPACKKAAGKNYGGGGSKQRQMHCARAGSRTAKGKKGHPKLKDCKRNAGPMRKQ